ncbi:MAG: hypothetical protein JWQ27_2317 [Ferruginibacter sp.]|nr:hypothetical protein [Ferruginibacter sp.]
MDRSDVYEELVRIVQEQFADVIKYLKSQESKGYIKYVEEETKGDRVGFIIGLRRFILRLSNITTRPPSAGFLFETFEIVDNENCYGHYRLVLKEELRMEGNFSIITFKNTENVFFTEQGEKIGKSYVLAAIQMCD